MTAKFDKIILEALSKHRPIIIGTYQGKPVASDGMGGYIDENGIRIPKPSSSGPYGGYFKP